MPQKHDSATKEVLGTFQTGRYIVAPVMLQGKQKQKENM